MALRLDSQSTLKPGDITMFKVFLKANGLTSKKFMEIIGGRSNVYSVRINKDGPNDLERYAMAAIASGLPMWEEKHSNLYVGVKGIVKTIKGLSNEINTN